MTIRKNLVAAISAAVALAMESERREAEALRESRLPPPRPPAPGPWAFSGRMAAAETRRLFQLRVMRSR